MKENSSRENFRIIKKYMLNKKKVYPGPGLQIRVCIGKLFSYFSSKTYVVGTHKNCLNETPKHLKMIGMKLFSMRWFFRAPKHMFKLMGKKIITILRS